MILIGLLFAIANADESITSRASHIDASLKRTGSAVVCVSTTPGAMTEASSSSKDDLTGAAENMNALLAALKEKFTASAPTIENSVARISSTLCLTLSRKH